MLKIIIILMFILMKGFEFTVERVNHICQGKELPENVKDVYDADEYDKWRNYENDSEKFSIISELVSIAFSLILLVTNAYAWMFRMLPGFNEYIQSLIVILVLSVMTTIISVPFKYYDTFVIEEKYGMNKTTGTTFWLDILKEFIISIIIVFLFTAIVMFLFDTFGNTAIILATVVMLVISLVLALIIIPLMRIFNKFTPLEDGELKDKLIGLCEKYGLKVKKIVVKDASRRTTKSNAFCTGLGKFKTISLDDNLVNNFEDDEIVAVFAHEFAHARYKHIIKSLPFSLFRTLITFAVLGLLLNYSGLCTAFGFDGVNYFFALQLLSIISWPLTKLLDIVSNYISRKHEYQADAFAAKEGYGDKLIAALKRLSKEALSDINPHPVKVVLDYSHPTLSQRITAIEGK